MRATLCAAVRGREPICTIKFEPSSKATSRKYNARVRKLLRNWHPIPCRARVIVLHGLYEVQCAGLNAVCAGVVLSGAPCSACDPTADLLYLRVGPYTFADTQAVPANACPSNIILSAILSRWHNGWRRRALRSMARRWPELSEVHARRGF